MVYLGSLLIADGRISSELGRRLGTAKIDFVTLEKIWVHSTLNRAKKIQIFNACIGTKLTYGLFSAHLNSKEKRRIDGFQARCLRKILRVPHAYYSRVSNDSILKRAGEAPLSERILKQQHQYLQKLAGRDHTDLTRMFVFEPGSHNLRDNKFEHGRGRPRIRWIDGLLR